MRNVLFFGLLLLMASSLALGGCGSDEGGLYAAQEFAYENPLFRNTNLIKAEATGQSQTPAFSWPASGMKHVVCAVFSERIGVKDNTIANTHRLVWMWHSGLKAGREGNVLWSQGVSDPQTEAAAKPLSSGSTYYWAVWAVDAQGVVAFSSIEYELVVP